MNDPEDGAPPQPEPGACGNPPRPPKQTARNLEDDPHWRGSILDEIERRLARLPQVRVKRDTSSIRCFPCEPNGFEVSLKLINNNFCQKYSVCYDGSHEEFSSRGEAVMAFGFGLSNGCRLKEYCRKGKAYRWIVEIWDVNERGWRPFWDFSEWTGVVQQFWPTPTIRYLQNRLIDLFSDDLNSTG